MPTIFVTAAKGAIVPQESHPTRYYPASGGVPMEVEVTPFVERLILMGDLVAIDPAQSDDTGAQE